MMVDSLTCFISSLIWFGKGQESSPSLLLDSNLLAIIGKKSDKFPHLVVALFRLEYEVVVSVKHIVLYAILCVSQVCKE